MAVIILCHTLQFGPASCSRDVPGGMEKLLEAAVLKRAAFTVVVEVPELLVPEPVAVVEPPPLPEPDAVLVVPDDIVSEVGSVAEEHVSDRCVLASKMQDAYPAHEAVRPER